MRNIHLHTMQNRGVGVGWGVGVSGHKDALTVRPGSVPHQSLSAIKLNKMSIHAYIHICIIFSDACDTHVEFLLTEPSTGNDSPIKYIA